MKIELHGAGIVVLSNYTWTYTTASAVVKYFQPGPKTLITANVKDVARKHDFGMEVIELNGPGVISLWQAIRHAGALRVLGFGAVAIDHGFNFNTIVLLFLIPFRDIFLIDPRKDTPAMKISRLRFLGLIAGKFRYFINKILIYLSKQFGMSVGLGQPSELSIETTTVCNLKCRGCPTGLGQLNRPPKPISRELFNEIVDNNSGNFRYFDIVYPFIFGEPMLNKDILEYIGILRRSMPPYARIELHTNGNIQIGEDAARRILEAGVDLVSISVDGTDKKAYESFRLGGDFDAVREFVRTLSAQKKRSGRINPEIVLQVILTRFSEHQVDQLDNLKKELGADRLLVKKFFYEFTDLSDEEGYSIAPTKKELLFDKDQKSAVINKKRHVCGWAYRSISIMCDGSVAPCCIDYNADLLKSLSAHGSSIKELWNSLNYRIFRKSMLDGKIDVCNKCFFT